MRPIKSYVKYNILSLKILGLWTDKEEHIFKTRFYWILTLFGTVGIVGTFNFTHIMHLIVHFEDLEVMVQSAYMALMFFLPNVKSVFYLKNWKIAKDLIAQLDDEDFQLRNLKHKQIADSLFRWITLIHIAYTNFCVTLMPLWLALPLFSSERKLPFLAWYPYDWKQPVYYEISYIHQFLGLMTNAIIHWHLDVLAFSLETYIGLECEILKDTLESIRNPSEKNRSKVEMEKALRLCIRHHQKILTFAKNSNKFLSPIVFSQFLASFLMLCLTMFEMTVVSPTSTEFMGVCMYQTGVFTQLLTHCWFGHQAITRSESLPNALYKTPWMDCSPKFKKVLLFFVMRSQRPIRILALNFFVLSLPTCLSILRFSWSFFAMLRTTNEKRHNR